MSRKPFECKDEYRDALEALKEFTKDKGAGFLLSYTDVERITSYNYGSQEFEYLLRVRFIKEMRKHRGIVLAAVAGVGYRFLSPDEVVQERPNLRIRKARNQFTRGQRELETATKDLNKIKSLTKRRLAISAEQYLKEKKREINAALRALKKTETLPVKKPI